MLALHQQLESYLLCLLAPGDRFGSVSGACGSLMKHLPRPDTCLYTYILFGLVCHATAEPKHAPKVLYIDMRHCDLSGLEHGVTSTACNFLLHKRNLVIELKEVDIDMHVRE